MYDELVGCTGSTMRTTRRTALVLPMLLLAGCGASVAVPPPLPTLPPAPTPALAISNPQHATLPLDESPHGDLTEWWYYTGHLAAQDGRHYGFELVFFQIRRGDAPPGYEAHFAVTDEHRNTFQFDQRSGSGEQGGRGPGFDLALGTWRVQGSQGHDSLQAQMANYGINLQLQADKPAVLHGGTGLIDFGQFGKSYYYSYTRMTVSGTIQDHGQPLTLTGIAWMDHQWGNFIVGSVGGWDWYALQLADGSDIMLSFNRDATNRQYFSYGSYVSQSGEATNLTNGTFSHQATGSWTSPATGIVYPSGWKVQVPTQQLSLILEPTVKNQELAFGGTTSLDFLDYWEGAVRISGIRAGTAISGQGYVELTGYRAPT
jgi:predicted secreted hydrolase